MPRPAPRSAPRAARRPEPGRYPVEGGTAELLADADRDDAWLLLLDGTAQSHVDLADPTRLEFGYVRVLGDVVDALTPSGSPLRVVHLGGGGGTLARYAAARRPGSRQVLVEVDAALVALVREQLGLGRVPGLRVRVGDARAVAATLPAAQADLVVVDVFEAAATPAHLASREAHEEVARLLAPGGVAAHNTTDGPGLAWVRGQVATLADLHPQVAVVAAPAVLRGRRAGNLVLLAGDRDLPLDHLQRSASRRGERLEALTGEELVRWTGGARVVTDATARRSPEVPAVLSG